jgi:hypothetical protein
MKKNLRKIAMGLGLCIALVACSKDEETIVVQVRAITVKDLPADTVTGLVNGRPQYAGSITYYSLVDDTIVSKADSATTKWDVAFSSTKILVNSGTSGPGLGGAFVYIGLFDALKTIPADSNFATDNSKASPSQYAIPQTGQTWFFYDEKNRLIKTEAGRVLVIRTATGKYAKIEILNYYKGGITPADNASDAEKLSKQRYYTFRYVYQPNGTKTF